MEDFGGLGGGLLIAVVAGLWLVYLIPSWISRRQYVTTERNVTRMQQAVRVMQQTAGEGDVVVAAEMTARQAAIMAREAKKQKKITLKAQREAARAATREMAAAAARQAAQNKTVASAAKAATANEEATMTEIRQDAHRGPSVRQVKALRRGRLLATSAGAAGVLAIVLGAIFAARVPQLWWLVAAGALLVGAAVLMLRAAARTARAYRARSGAAARVGSRTRVAGTSAAFDAAAHETSADAATDVDGSVGEDAEHGRQWTPSQMPKPLYLTHSAVRAAAEAEARRIAEGAGVAEDVLVESSAIGAEGVVDSVVVEGVVVERVTAADDAEAAESAASVDAAAASETEAQRAEGRAGEQQDASAPETRTAAQEELKRATDEAVEALRAAQADESVAKIESAKPDAEYEWLAQIEETTAAAHEAVRGARLDEALRRRRQAG